MKQFKNFTLLIGLLIISAKGFCQFPLTPISVTVNQNQCYTYQNVPNGYSVDSVQMIQAPSHGVLSATPTPFTYCPDSNFIGQDTALIWGCVYSGAFLFGCDTFEIIFSVQQATCNLIVSVTQDSGVCIGGNRHYLAVTSNGTSPYTYLWSDGTTNYGACELNPGQGTCVTVTDANGCSGTACSNGNGCTLALIISDSSPCAGPLPGLTGSATGGTAPYTYYWMDGLTQNILVNGTTNTGTDMIVCNLPPGTYCLYVQDANGCYATQCFTIQGAGGCYFTYNSNPLLGGIVAFAAANDSAYTGNQWIWNFGDGTSGTGANPSHTFAPGGYYYVSMSVYYTNGDSCSYTSYIYVQDSTNNYPNCQAWFYYYMDSLNNSTYHFTDYSVYNAVTWSWDFGDGTSSTAQNPTHTYNAQGTWTVCLTTTDGAGCSSNYCQQLSNIPVQDLEAYLYHQTTVTPGFPVWVYLGYYNAGTVMVNGTVTYRYPAGTTVNATSLVPAAHDVAHRLLTFNVGNVLPGTSDYIYVDLNASASLTLGSLAQDTMWINPIAGDATPSNNVSFVVDSVVGSWDPNDKAVSPKGEGSHGIVPMSTNQLSYRIRFQNTGSAPANTVQIIDAISSNIDLTSVQVTGASHEHTFQIIGNELVVNFANINLPDSGLNYTASQGYIDVRAKLKPGLSNGTQIFNTADIYFDFNSPVITNTVVTTLGSYVSGIEAVQNFDFAIMPNPANNQVSLRGEFEKNASFELMNQLGQVTLSGAISSGNQQVDIAGLSNGIYLVKIKSGDKTGIQKLVVAK